MSYFKFIVLSGAFISFTLNGCSNLHAETASLCKKNETTLFSCSLTNSKVASICTSESRTSEYVEYRYGSVAKIELSYNASPKNKKNIFNRAEITYANNSEDTIWFHNEAFTYSIFMPTRGTPGVEVTRNKEVVARHECAGGWRGAIRGPRKDSKFVIDHGTGDSTKFESLW
jgi:hypothetical protein